MASKKSTLLVLLSVLMVASMLLASCAPAAPTAEATEQAAATTEAPATTEAAGTQAPAVDASKYKMAMVLPGSIQDADYNAVGYSMLQVVKDAYGIETAYSEQVAVADAERVGREYISSGYNIVAFHGGQFLTAVTTLANEFPEVNFIIETGGENPDLPANVWNIGRKYYLGAYSLGVLAAKATTSKKVAFVGGVKLPDFIAVVNTLHEAIQATDPTVEFMYNFSGDSNDPVKSRETAQTMIDSGADVIINFVNLGTQGVIEAAKAADHKVLLTSFYTDKLEMAPENFTTSLLFDFGVVFKDVVGQIIAGTKGGYYQMQPGKGMSLAPITNVSDDVATLVNDTFSKIASGEIQPVENTKEITFESGK